MFYGRDWSAVIIEVSIRETNEYIRCYKAKRIKCSLGSISPLNYRKSLEFAA
jgi:hypothetical protein